MRIQHNILAMNAYRNYNNNTSALGKNLEKLSSGYKINRAGDDAAGLAISEKMRAQITGLNAAQKNVKDGVSLVKTAEGAMQEIQDMLNRMDYLATQSANGTYDNEVDRANLQKEVDALKTEINRIADSANFNGIKLLDGSLDSTITSETVATYTDGKNNIPILSQTSTNPFEEVGDKTVLHKDGVKTAQTASFEVELHNTNLVGAHGDTVSVKIGDKTLNFTFDRNATSNTATAGVLKEGQVTASDLASAIAKAFDASDKLIGGQEFTVTANGAALKFEQAAAPTHEGENVEACKGITIEHTSSTVASKTEVYLTDAQKEALAASDKIVIGGQEYAITIGSATSTGVSADCGGVKVQYDNGKLTVMTGSGAAPTSIAIGSAAATDATASVSAAGTVAAAASATASVFSGAVSTAKITLMDGKGTAVTSIDLMSGTVTEVNIDGVSYTMAYSSNGSITMTAVSAGANGNKEIGYIIETTATATAPTVSVGGVISAANGKDAKDASATYSMASVSVGTTIEFNGMKFTVENSVEETLQKVAQSVNATSYGEVYNVRADGKNLIVEAKGVLTAASVDAVVSVKTGGVEQKTVALTAANVNSSGSGSWNIQSTKNVDGKAAGGDLLASTTFKLNSGIVRDGNVLHIGKDEYTFKVGKDSTATGKNVIDLSAYEEGDADLIDAAGKLLSQQTNGTFTIGYDKANSGVVSLHEKATQSDYSNGELGDLQKFDDMVYFESIGDQTVNETTSAGGKALTLQIGDTSDSWNQMEVSVGDMHAKAMGTGTYTDEDGNKVEVEKTIANIDISSQEGAAEAVRVVKNAINYVSSVRGDLGAVQNRLEHTQNNLSVMAENIQDAESTIRDTDVAEEMMSYVKNNILVQSAQAMLAQANQVPQGVLQLLG